MSEYCTFLDESDFHLRQSKNGKLLSHKIPGLSFVLFYSTKCKFCPTMVDRFKMLPSVYKGIKFCMFNITNKDTFIKKINSNTITRMEYVPYMMVYMNGVPYVQYTGGYDVNDIVSFLKNVEDSISAKHHMRNQMIKKEEKFDTKKSQEEKKSHPCTYGVPICGDGTRDNVCYVTMQEAYDDITSS
jgi:thiol-disulfide isomerase/thioredoxin